MTFTTDTLNFFDNQAASDASLKFVNNEDNFQISVLNEQEWQFRQQNLNGRPVSKSHFEVLLAKATNVSINEVSISLFFENVYKTFFEQVIAIEFYKNDDKLAQGRFGLNDSEGKLQSVKDRNVYLLDENEQIIGNVKGTK